MTPTNDAWCSGTIRHFSIYALARRRAGKVGCAACLLGATDAAACAREIACDTRRHAHNPLECDTSGESLFDLVRSNRRLVRVTSRFEVGAWRTASAAAHGKNRTTKPSARRVPASHVDRAAPLCTYSRYFADVTCPIPGGVPDGPGSGS